MNKNNINYLTEYLSLALILSYFFINNIYLVLIGLTCSIYLLNSEIIKKFIKIINQMFFITNITNNITNTAIKANDVKIESIKEDSNLTLVETIEELGFIPSENKHNDSNAA